MMDDDKLLETVADIAYCAGEMKYFSGDSRADIFQFIQWAQEFESFHRFTNWGESLVDYRSAVEEFAAIKIKGVLL